MITNKKDLQDLIKSSFVDIVFLIVILLIPDPLSRVLIAVSFLYGFHRHRVMQEGREGPCNGAWNSPRSGLESFLNNNFRDVADVSLRKPVVTDDDLQHSVIKDEESDDEVSQLDLSLNALSLAYRKIYSQMQRNQQQQKWAKDSGNQKLFKSYFRSSEDGSLTANSYMSGRTSPVSGSKKPLVADGDIFIKERRSPDSGFESFSNNDSRSLDDIFLSAKEPLVANASNDDLESLITNDKKLDHEAESFKGRHSTYSVFNPIFRSEFALPSDASDSSIQGSSISNEERSNHRPMYSGNQKVSKDSFRSLSDGPLSGSGEGYLLTDYGMENSLKNQSGSMYQEGIPDLDARLNRVQFKTKVEEMHDTNLDILLQLERGKNVIQSGIPSSLLYHQKELNIELDKLFTTSKMLRSDLRELALKCDINHLPELKENTRLLSKTKELKSDVRELILANKLHLEKRPAKHVKWPFFNGKSLPFLPTFLKEMDHCFDLVGSPLTDRGKILKDKTTGYARQILNLASDNLNPSYKEIETILKQHFSNAASMTDLACRGHRNIGKIKMYSHDNRRTYNDIREHMKYVNAISKVSNECITEEYLRTLEKQLPRQEIRILYNEKYNDLDRKERFNMIKKKLKQLEFFYLQETIDQMTQGEQQPTQNCNLRTWNSADFSNSSRLIHFPFPPPPPPKETHFRILKP